MKLMNKLLISGISALLFGACSVYSFTGASLVSGEETISIDQFYNNALLGPADMSQVFTEKMRDYFQQNTNLTLVNSNGDLQFEGYIASYNVTPVTPSASQNDNALQVSSSTRISISVHVTYINLKNDEFDFDQKFSFFRDFETEQVDISAVEDQFVEEIFDQIIFDIFNASVANW
jgi:hypothetical protein